MNYMTVELLPVDMSTQKQELEIFFYLIKNHVFDILCPMLSVRREEKYLQTLRNCNKNLREKGRKRYSGCHNSIRNKVPGGYSGI